MNPSIKLDLNELYLITSRLNIMISICMCSHFQAHFKESHLSTMERILRYVKGTSNRGLWYPRLNSCYLIGYTNVDYAGSRIDGKTTSGDCQFIRHCLVLWHNKKQNNVALSTTKVEYIVVGSCYTQLL